MYYQSTISNRQYIGHQQAESWGKNLYIMDLGGWSMVHLYMYKDDVTKMYIENLHVNTPFRKERRATEIFNFIYVVATEWNIKDLYLFVEKNSWVYSWYLRLGFKDFKIHESDSKLIWMRKELTIIKK